MLLLDIMLPGTDGYAVFRQVKSSGILKTTEKRKPQGTYCYRGLWEYIDHILVSKSLSPYCSERITVGRLPFLLTREGVPYRTFLGPSYQGGISDHLPIWADLFIR